ncbi:hypothetical protein CIG75_07640 [Tumebacillus algifaecis]|uniref:Cytochrome c domain-containing protein n=1 Tax=Tumebacillus algifaecis TaxID=1214604 RepID=A0A223D0C3_9BACL|nr:cbb3-type cytochrome c oxidase subunit II [Tumebacillus algifaecis]ASS74863.1 hypothetical protein CIG75_07640 [Tumebacillus algifaecis]
MANDAEKNPAILLFGAAGLVLMGVIGTLVLPYFDEGIVTPTQTAKLRNYPSDSAEARGRHVYVREGCLYCHSQQVRPVRADSKLGPPSLPGDYYYDAPVVTSTQRFGPDLMWVGQRYSADWQHAHLLNPQQIGGPGSIMPKYNYLSQQDRDDLVAYLLSLKRAPETKD